VDPFRSPLTPSGERRRPDNVSPDATSGIPDGRHAADRCERFCRAIGAHSGTCLKDEGCACAL
jgi:hypothetical protein